MPEADFRDLLHALNRRYRDAWDRAERLQCELDHIHGSRAWRFFDWTRRVKRLFFGSSAAVAPVVPPFVSEALPERKAAPTSRVTIVIPFKNQGGLLKNCLRSLRIGTYRRLQVVLVDNGSTCKSTRAFLKKTRWRRGIRVVSAPGSFNFSRLCNRGAMKARGDYLLFLNNDTEVLTSDWLERLLEVAENRRVGVVGGTLLYPDGAIQHVGLQPIGEGRWHHQYCGQQWKASDFPHSASVQAVTGACLLIRRKLFQELGGFDESLPVTFNDVDLCCRVRQRGLLVAVTPHARLIHYESLSRGYERDPLRYRQA